MKQRRTHTDICRKLEKRELRSLQNLTRRKPEGQNVCGRDEKKELSRPGEGGVEVNLFR